MAQGQILAVCFADMMELMISGWRTGKQLTAFS
jgi:hypothetical protein